MSEPCIRDKEEGGAITAWCVGYSEREIGELLERHPSWYRSTEDFDS